MTTIMSNGIAQIDNCIVEQLQAKHPPRTANVSFPTQKWDEEEIEDEKAAIVDDNDTLKELPRMAGTALNEEEVAALPSLTINARQIFTAVKSAKRLTSGGLQQITPWLLKRAFLADTNQECAIIA